MGVSLTDGRHGDTNGSYRFHGNGKVTFNFLTIEI